MRAGTTATEWRLLPLHKNKRGTILASHKLLHILGKSGVRELLEALLEEFIRVVLMSVQDVVLEARLAEDLTIADVDVGRWNRVAKIALGTVTMEGLLVNFNFVILVDHLKASRADAAFSIPFRGL